MSGEAGPQGASEAQGPQGDRGPIWLQGDRGQGLVGEEDPKDCKEIEVHRDFKGKETTRFKGEIGEQGPVGPRGEQGLMEHLRSSTGQGLLSEDLEL